MKCLIWKRLERVDLEKYTKLIIPDGKLLLSRKLHRVMWKWENSKRTSLPKQRSKPDLNIPMFWNCWDLSINKDIMEWFWNIWAMVMWVTISLRTTLTGEQNSASVLKFLQEWNTYIAKNLQSSMVTWKLKMFWCPQMWQPWYAILDSLVWKISWAHSRQTVFYPGLPRIFHLSIGRILIFEKLKHSTFMDSECCCGKW